MHKIVNNLLFVAVIASFPASLGLRHVWQTNLQHWHAAKTKIGFGGLFLILAISPIGSGSGWYYTTLWMAPLYVFVMATGWLFFLSVLATKNLR